MIAYRYLTTLDYVCKIIISHCRENANQLVLVCGDSDENCFWKYKSAKLALINSAQVAFGSNSRRTPALGDVNSWLILVHRVQYYLHRHKQITIISSWSTFADMPTLACVA